MLKTSLTQVFFKPNTLSEKSKVKSPIERAEILVKSLRKQADDEMSSGVLLGKKVKNSVKAVGLLARLKVRKQRRDWKSQNEGNQTCVGSVTFSHKRNKVKS